MTKGKATAVRMKWRRFMVVVEMGSLLTLSNRALFRSLVDWTIATGWVVDPTQEMNAPVSLLASVMVMETSFDRMAVTN